MDYTVDIRIHLVQHVFMISNFFVFEEENQVMRLRIKRIVVDVMRFFVIQTGAPSKI